MSLPIHSTAYEASRVLKSVGGALTFLQGYNSGPEQFIQLHDSKTVPADTAIPVMVFLVPEESNFCLNSELTGMSFTNGIVVCNSSTGPTKTVGAADCFFTAAVS